MHAHLCIEITLFKSYAPIHRVTVVKCIFSYLMTFYVKKICSYVSVSSNTMKVDVISFSKQLDGIFEVDPPLFST